MVIPLFAQVLGLHILGMLVGFGSVLVVDVFGLLWLARRVELSLVVRVATVTQKLIWIGWTVSVVSGIVLLNLKGYVDALTMIKIALVIALGINGIALHWVKKELQRIGNGTIPFQLRLRVAMTSFVSLIGWWGAASIGWLHSHVDHEIDWPLYAREVSIAWLFFIGATVVWQNAIRRT